MRTVIPSPRDQLYSISLPSTSSGSSGKGSVAHARMLNESPSITRLGASQDTEGGSVTTSSMPTVCSTVAVVPSPSVTVSLMS